MTPIQELIETAKRNPQELNCALIPWTYILSLEEKEKEFAKQCFEAGRIFGMNNSYSIEWGEDTTQPDFDNWYKQFEQ